MVAADVLNLVTVLVLGGVGLVAGRLVVAGRCEGRGWVVVGRGCGVVVLICFELGVGVCWWWLVDGWMCGVVCDVWCGMLVCVFGACLGHGCGCGWGW